MKPGEPTLGEANNTHSYPSKQEELRGIPDVCGINSNERLCDCHRSWVQLGGWVAPSPKTVCCDISIISLETFDSC